MQSDFENRYHDLESQHFWFVSRRHGITKLVENLGTPKHASILDVGCSSGQMITDLQTMGYDHVTGIDISENAIAQCKQRKLTDVHVMNGAAPELPKQHYDLLLASDVLEHIEDEHRTLKNWNQLLRPGGKAIIFVPAYETLWSAHDELNRHYRRYTKRRLIAAVHEAGFNVIHSGYWNTALLLPLAVVRPMRRILSGLKPRTWLDPDTNFTDNQSDLGDKPPHLNRFLTWMLCQENRWLGKRVGPPCGVSVYGILSRPDAS